MKGALEGISRKTTTRTTLPLALASLLVALPLSAGCVARTVDERGVSRQETGAPSSSAATTPSPSPPIVFAVIGDYGSGDSHEQAVARLVGSWDPAYIITTGDGYYARAGGSGTGRYDASTGRFYCEWLKDIRTTGIECRSGDATRNAFFPALGNHDYDDATPAPETYLQYFRLPGDGLASSSGNERYYDFVEGPVHFFVLNSNEDEPDGAGPSSKQAKWLRQALLGSSSRWNIVCGHHPPYSSDRVHGSTDEMRWPFERWGADAVFSGHAHVYERISRDGMVYFVNGLGGAPRYAFGTPVPGSRIRFSANWGAQKVTVREDRIDVEFYDVTGKRVDRYRLTH